MRYRTVFLSSLLKNRSTSRVFSILNNTLIQNGIDVKLLNSTNDIWIRDFMPIQVGKNHFVQFSLTKNYYYQKDRYKRTNPAPICQTLGIEPIIPIYEGKPIYLDGGNIIRGFDMAIITEKVFTDNDIPKDDLLRILKEVLQVKQIIIIPTETHDDTGHADGMVRFFDENTVLANDYSDIDVAKDFRNRFYQTLEESGLDVLLVPYHPMNKKINGYWVANGCYINYLQVGEKIFLPTFNNPINDTNAIKRFGEIFGNNNVIPIPSYDIALGGGVLNCLTWEL